MELGHITIYNTDTTSNIIGYKGKMPSSTKDKKIHSGDIIKIGFPTYYIDQNGKAIYGEIHTQKKDCRRYHWEINLNNRK